MKEERIVSMFKKNLENEDSATCAYSIISLARLGDTSVVPQLMGVLKKFHFSFFEPDLDTNIKKEAGKVIHKLSVSMDLSPYL